MQGPPVPLLFLRALGVGLACALGLAGVAPAWAAAEADAATAAAALPKRADFRDESASADARHVADWAVDSGDNAGLPFVIVDKVGAKVFVFDAAGALRGASSVLVGLAVGDSSVPGIGSRKLSTIRPEERTTPAGRFVAALDRSLGGEEILWVDYDSGVALHRVIATLPKERRLQRLESAKPVEHRITYGCINVPVKFYESVVSPAFQGTNGIVYVLPDTRPVREVFGSYDVGSARKAPAAAGREGGGVPMSRP
jgi:hypothetical protein